MESILVLLRAELRAAVRAEFDAFAETGLDKKTADITEACRLLDCTRVSIYNYVRDGFITPINRPCKGVRLKFHLRDLMDFKRNNPKGTHR
jgi:hypothetical protein